jgi:putative ABC transport system permease protein
MALYLAFKEVWRNKGRFLLFSLVIALITTLVLFIAALAEGLATANREFIQKLDAELLAFQSNVDVSINASRIGRSQMGSIRRIEGVENIGSLGFASGSIVFDNGKPNLNVSLIGVEPNAPGDPVVLSGKSISTTQSEDVVIDQNIVQRARVRIGDTITIKVVQGTKEEFYKLRVIGTTTGQQYQFAPAVFVPYRTWDKIRPQAQKGGSLVELTSNVVAIKLTNPADTKAMAQKIKAQANNFDVVDKQTAIEAIPGYGAQQSTLNTQRAFTLLIGVLVIGGFFQIQLLQKIPQIGVLKAIGTSNSVVAAAVVMQIILVTTFGVLLGGLATLGLASGMPSNVPISFNGSQVVTAIISLLAIGPLGGLVSVRLAITVEPLVALGLSS